MSQPVSHPVATYTRGHMHVMTRAGVHVSNAHKIRLLRGGSQPITQFQPSVCAVLATCYDERVLGALCLQHTQPIDRGKKMSTNFSNMFVNLSSDKTNVAKVTVIQPAGTSALDVGTDPKTGEVDLVLGFKVYASTSKQKNGTMAATVGISGGLFPIKKCGNFAGKINRAEYLMQRVMMLGDNAGLFAALYCEVEKIAREWRDLADTVKQVSIWKQMMLEDRAGEVLVDMNEAINGYIGDELCAQFNVAMERLTTLPEEAAAPVAPAKSRRKGATLPTL